VNLVIDIGNTRVKTGVFDHNELVDAKVFDEVNAQVLQALADQYGVTHILTASTGIFVDSEIVRVPGVSLHLSSETPIPIDNRYETPETLGQDRLAGMVGASWLHPQTNVLVIDAGTCITFDLLEKSGIYLGGNIAPGLDMRYMAMHTFTKRLPTVSRPGSASMLGRTTETALQNGGLIGVLMEITGYMEMLKGQFSELHTLLTGGDAGYLAEHLKTGLSVEPNLVLIGLNQILNFNVAKYN